MIGVGTMVRPTLRTLANKVVEEMSATSVVGHSRPMHSAPVPINVRCYSNSDMIVRRSEPLSDSCNAASSNPFDHSVGVGHNRAWSEADPGA